MNPAKENNPIQELVLKLDELTRLYQNLHELLVRERKHLIDANVNELAESNRTKEALLQKIKQVDHERELISQATAQRVGAQEPRLLAIAEKLPNDKKNQFKSIHEALSLLLSRVAEINRENETYTDSALRNVDGAISELKDLFAGKSVYGKKGQVGTGPEKSGNLVRREA